MPAKAESFIFTYRYYIIAVLSFVLYANTLNHDFALDDAIVITENAYTKEGISGFGKILSSDSFDGFFQEEKDLVSGGRYRPLAQLIFAFLWQLVGNNSAAFHLLNVLLYVALCLLVLTVLEELFNSFQLKNSVLLAFLGAIVFTVHPIHTEAVANVKGADEVLALLLALISLRYSIKASKTKHYFILAILFLMALLAKEIAIVFLPVIFGVLWFRKSNTKVAPVTFSLLVSCLVYVVLRANAVGLGGGEESQELLNNAFVDTEGTEKIGTIFKTFAIYIKLLFFPHPLTYDYYPYHISLVSVGHISSLIGIILFAASAVAAIVLRKKHILISLGIFIILFALFIVSNLLFPVGTFMAERFLFTPSFGFVILIALLFNQLRNNAFKYLIISIIGIIFSVTTINRNKVWKNDFTLFSNDVQISMNSAKANAAYAGILIDASDTSRNKTLYLEKAIKHAKKATEIHPTYSLAYNLTGNAIVKKDKNIDSAMVYYLKALQTNKSNQHALSNIKKVIGHQEASKRVQTLKLLLKLYPTDFDFIYTLGNTYGKELQNLNEATIYLEKAHKIRPKEIRVLKDLGVAYAMMSQFQQSINYTNKAIEFNNKDPQLYFNLGLSYRSMNMLDEANKNFAIAEQLKQSKN
jgi:tetratricopeptide (TPR) repeat protein